MWPFESSDDTFRNSVRREFSPLADQCGATLKQLEPVIFGFVTDYAILTIGAYPGHFQRIGVALRRRKNGEPLSIKDHGNIGLARVEEFMTGTVSPIYNQRWFWSSWGIAREVTGLVKVTKQVALPFLICRDADWTGLRAFVDAKIEQALSERSRVGKPS